MIKQTSQESMDIIFSDPNFYQALMEALSRIKDGSARWHTFDDVFSKDKKQETPFVVPPLGGKTP